MRLKGPDDETLGDALARLRLGQGLSSTELARLASVPRASIRDWETARFAPSVAALDRLLAALGADDRTRARLVAAIGGSEARTLLAHTPWGAPVDQGQVLRAMRLRAGRTQADLARAVGVRQGSLAKWEAGDAVPSDETFERLLATLGATPEEAAALQTTRHCLQEPIADPFVRIAEIAHDRPVALRDVLLLGVEAELWPQATRDPSAEAALSRAMAVRAQQALVRGAWPEIRPLVRRAVRLAATSGEFDGLAPALYALNWTRQRQSGDAWGAALSLARWASRMRDPSLREWLTVSHSLALVRAGETAPGVRVLQAFVDRQDPGTVGRQYHGEDLVEAWLLAGEPERAEEALLRLGDDASPVAAAKVAAAKGEEPSPEVMAGLRMDENAIGRDEARRIERLLAQVRRGHAPRLE